MLLMKKILLFIVAVAVVSQLWSQNVTMSPTQPTPKETETSESPNRGEALLHLLLNRPMEQ